jgi:hypothetical protein
VSDFDLSVLISRNYLGLPPLQLNDHLTYACSGAQFLGGQVSWRLNEISGPYTEGATAIDATRDMVTEPLSVEVYGSTNRDRELAEQAVIAAFSQLSYTLTVDVDNVRSVYTGVPSGYQQTYIGPRLAHPQGLLTIQFRRQPRPVVTAI